MGMGRNSSRLANRRILQSSASERPSSTGSSNSLRQRPVGGGVSTRAMGGAESDDSDEAMGDADYELDAMDDDDDWFATSKRKTGRKKPSTKKSEKRSKFRNPLLGGPVDLGSTKVEESRIFQLDDLLDAPPISQRGNGRLFGTFSGLDSAETPSPSASETIVLRNRKVKKPKAEDGFGSADLGIGMVDSVGSFDEDSREATSVSKEEKSPQIICLDDDEIL